MSLKHLGGCKPKPAFYRFSLSWEVDPKTMCWNWMGYLNRGAKKQYGSIKIDGKSVAAHRFSWEIYNGSKVPDGMIVMHNCDNPRCVNPDHLCIGTTQDNSDDKVKKNRQAKGLSFVNRKAANGSRNGLAKLTENQAKEIFNNTNSQRKIAERYGVSQTVIHNIKSMKTWKIIHD